MNDLPDHIKNARYDTLVKCQITGVTRLSQAACFYRQARYFNLPNNKTQDQSINYQLTRRECKGCPNKLNARDRLKLQKAFRSGFRFEGKRPQRSYPRIRPSYMEIPFHGKL